MRILIIDNDYPNEKNLYGDVFAHVRVKAYSQTHECRVLSFTAENDFVYEGIDVRAVPGAEAANEQIRAFRPAVILIHFVNKQMIEEVIPHHTLPYIIWVHGYEALSWKRRMFNYTWKNFIPHRFWLLVQANRRQLKSLAGLIRQANAGERSVYFVFVSEWMRKICRKDTGASPEKYSIIPNPIDTRLFYFREKDAAFRKKILLIRPFSTRKYATDIAMAALLKLAHQPFFPELDITIVGSGRYFEKDTGPLKQFSNVKLVNRFLSQPEIKTFHDQHGIFLCPTRQDAQGVSMCEAMSSGLVPVTSYNTAIPEFVVHGESGLLAKSATEVAAALENLYSNPTLFRKLCAGAGKSVMEKCGLDRIVAQELDLLAQQENK